jgi:hypothetical protein
MNKGGFSWTRFVGISGAKARMSRKIGIPLTRSGRRQKIGRTVTVEAACCRPHWCLSQSLGAFDGGIR